MKGTEKQIKWAEDIISNAEAMCDRIIRDAESYERSGDATINRPVKVEIAKQLKAMVIDGLTRTDNASDIINNRNWFGYSTLLAMAIQYSRQ